MRLRAQIETNACFFLEGFVRAEINSGAWGFLKGSGCRENTEPHWVIAVS